jgi:hypothetical protein
MSYHRIVSIRLVAVLLAIGLLAQLARIFHKPVGIFEKALFL